MHWRLVRCWMALLVGSVLLVTAACGGTSSTTAGRSSGRGQGGSLPSGIVEGEQIANPELVRAACKEGKVVIYTGQAQADEQAIDARFAKQFPCVKVSVISTVTGILYERVVSEAKAGKVGGDVLIMTDESLADKLVDAGYVRKWTPPQDPKIPVDLKHEGYWYPGSGAMMIIDYNTQLVKPAEAPKTWTDLLDPKWQGKIATAPPTIGGTAWDLFYFLQHKIDPNYWQKLAAQHPKLYTSYSPVTTAVARGEFLVSLNCDLCDYSSIQKGAPIKDVFPPDGVAKVPYPIMLLANGPDSAAAELFGNWYLSKQGQTALVDVRGAYSWRSDAPAPKGNPPLATLNVYTVPRNVVSEEHDKLIAEWERIFQYR